MTQTQNDTRTPSELAQLGAWVTLQNVKSGRMRTNAEIWHDWYYNLTDSDIQQITDVLGGRQRTRDIIGRRLRSLSSMPSKWFLDRIHFCKHSNKWRYCAGQDHPGELAEIRRYFLSL